MKPTLITIPHEIAGVPVAGAGWLLGIWILIAGGWIAWNIKKYGFSNEVRAFLPAAGIVAFAILFVMPWLETRDSAGNPLGLTIRGYGFMVLLGVLGGVGLAAWEARRMGIHPDVIFAITFWMFVSGIAGARLFFVVQYWSRFEGDTWSARLSNAFRFTEGGLVVYGALIGGLVAAVVYLRLRQLPLRPIADVLSLGFLVGLALGRLGCLMNGCCWGGVCDHPLAIQFPPASPPYLDQLQDGPLLGLEWERSEESGSGRRVAAVQPDSPAADRGIAGGETVSEIQVSGRRRFLEVREQNGDEPVVRVRRQDGPDVTWKANELPPLSLPVQPAQIYAALNAGLLCLLLWAYLPFRRRDGELLGLLLVIYPITRFALEWIRVDEAGRFGTGITIAQWVSLGLLAAGIIYWIWLLRRPLGTLADPPAPAPPSGS